MCDEKREIHGNKIKIISSSQHPLTKPKDPNKKKEFFVPTNFLSVIYSKIVYERSNTTYIFEAEGM